MALAGVLKLEAFFDSAEAGDGTDHLNSVFTSNFLVALGVFSGFKQFGGTPVECMVPDWFSSSWEKVLYMG